MARIRIKAGVDSGSLTKNLLAFWKLDDLTDSAGNGNTLTNNNNVTFDSGKIGNAAVFSSGKWLGCNMEFNTYSSDWSFSVWMYQTSTPDNINTFPLVTDNLVNHWALQCNPDGEVGFGYYVNGGLWGPLPLNTWTHVAASCANGVVTLYINGISQGSGLFNGQNDGNEFRLNTAFGDQVYNGKLDAVGLWHRALTEEEIELLYNNGNGVEYFENFGKFNIKRGGVDQFFNNVSLLLPMDASFNDFSNNNFTLTSYGNPIISQDQSKFSSAAGYFGPSNDYLSAASSSLFGFGTGDFTIEMWIYPQGTSAFQGFFNANDYTNGILMRWHATSQFDSLYINSTPYDWQPAIHAPVNTWSHIALVRYGGTVKMFVNGVNRIGSVTNNSDIGSSAVPLIGASAHNPGEGFNGYINELRVTKGVARYTTDFTPPTNKFSIGGGGKVKINKSTFPMKDLLAFWKLNDTSDSSGNNNNLTDNNGVVFGEPGVVGNGARTTWGNNGSYLTTDLFVNGDSTLSLWFRFDSLPVPNPQGYQDRYPLVFQKYPYCALGTNSNYPRKLILTDLATWGLMSTNEIFTVGQWCHIVTVIENSKAKVYADGVLILETPAQYTNTFQSGGRLLGFGGDNVDLATSYGTDTRYDSIGMWSRALTYNEVMTLYNNGAGLEP